MGSVQALTSPSALSEPDRSHSWGMCCHAQSDIRDDTYGKLKDLGVLYVRTDISWNKFEPVQGQLNSEYIQHIDGIINKLDDVDIELFPVLTHAPDWARGLYLSDKTAYWASLQSYHSKVAELWGDKIEYYQIENELNHPTRIPYFSKSDIPNYCKYAKAGINEHDSGFKTVLNVLCENIGWQIEMNDWLDSGANEYINIIGLDIYPLTWGDTATLWSPLRQAMTLVNQRGTAWYGKDLMVAETGFSTYDAVHNDEVQKGFIEVAIKHLNDLVIDYNKEYDSNRVHMICWYELYDNEENSIDLEDNFGICNVDGSKKVGYSALKHEIGHYEDLTAFSSGMLLPFMGFGVLIVIIIIVIYFIVKFTYKKYGNKSQNKFIEKNRR